MGRSGEPTKPMKKASHGPLAAQLKEDVVLSASHSSASAGKRASKKKAEAKDGSGMDAVMSARIMKLARDQQREELEQDGAEPMPSTSTGPSVRPSLLQDDEDEEEDDYGSEEDDVEEMEFDDLVSSTAAAYGTSLILLF